MNRDIETRVAPLERAAGPLAMAIPVIVSAIDPATGSVSQSDMVTIAVQ